MTEWLYVCVQPANPESRSMGYGTICDGIDYKIRSLDECEPALAPDLSSEVAVQNTCVYAVSNSER